MKAPAKNGAFEEPLLENDMCRLIGGNKDTNFYLTRRMLFLLEGEWVFNRSQFEKTRKKLINVYVDEHIESEKIALYLLNDIIRYWRTICVDYEHKIADEGKAKAIRLIKLRFSRMLLYFSGVIAISQTRDGTYDVKRIALENSLSKPPLERIISVLGEGFSKPLGLYNDFLTALDDQDIRAQLELSGDEGLSTKAYENLSKKARFFRSQLLEILMCQIGTDHPVIRSLLL